MRRDPDAAGRRRFLIGTAGLAVLGRTATARFESVVNRGSAREIGLAIPQDILVRTDEVIR